MDRSLPEDDQKGAEVSARAFNKRDLCVVRDAAGRASSMEFTNFGSSRIARLHEYDWLTYSLREDREIFSALQLKW